MSSDVLTSHSPTTEYRIGSRIGEGGMAAVFRGSMRTPAGERRVAVKRLRTDRDVDAAAADRFAAEARLVFQLTHANICQVLDLGTNDGGMFILMELVEGMDLRTLLRRLRADHRTLDVACALFVAREIAQALDYAHRRIGTNGLPLRLVHGDVKPQNVLLSEEGEVKLADFGIATAVRSHAPGNGLVAGTPGYMAPEVEALAADQRADVFSLGMTLFAALGGRVPRAATPIDVARLIAERPEIGAEIGRIVERATALDADKRYASAGEMQQALAYQLARNYPEFTPLVLASTLRSYRVVEQPHEPDAAATIVSLVRSPTPPAFSSKIELSEARPQTVPVEPSRSRPYFAAAALVLACAAGLLYTSVRTKRATAATPIATKAPIVETPVPAPPPPSVEPPTASPPTVSPPVVAPVVKAASGGRHVPDRAPGFITVNAEPWGAVLFDGKRIAPQTPLYKRQVPSGAHVIVIVDPETAKRSPPHRVQVKPGETSTLGIRW